MANNASFENLDNEFDAIVIGGGIVGAGILRDLSLNGVKTLLLDKKDFSSQTSSKSSKMLHGGIRYLENMDFDLVFEALHEKNLWLQMAPHLCYESKFYLPVFKDSIRPLWMIRIGLFLYDFLSQFQNSPYKIVGKSSVVSSLDGIKQSGLKGAGIYHDAIVDDRRLTIEVILDGLRNTNSKALNHVSMESFEILEDNVHLIIKDQITNETKKVICKELILATGPFTDKILKDHPQVKWKDKLLPSKGSHIWLKKDALKIDSPLVLTPKDGRVIFVIPQKDFILVGTTEVEHKGDLFDLSPTEEEINYLLSNVNEYFPNANLKKEHIEKSFSGIRPLVKEDESSDRSKTARNHKYFQPHPRLHVMMGGKYTTFRIMAKDVARVVCNKLNVSYNSLVSKSPLKVKKVRPFSKDYQNEEILEYMRENELIRKEEDLNSRISPEKSN